MITYPNTTGGTAIPKSCLTPFPNRGIILNLTTELLQMLKYHDCTKALSLGQWFSSFFRFENEKIGDTFNYLYE
jgi:hypothetical protein